MERGRIGVTVSKNGNHRTPVWVHPWGYAEGWFISIGLLVTGFALQLAGGGLDATALAWPINLYIGIVFTVLLIVVWVPFRERAAVAWLGRVPAAICSIALITFLVLLMGLILQDDEQAAPWIRRLGLSSMTSSWPFLLAMFFFLAALGMATLKRLIPFKGKNVGFLLNHLGLYVAVLGGLLGSADVERLLMELREGELNWHASDRNGHLREMPLAMELIRFRKEEYPPKIAVIETESQAFHADTRANMFEIHEGRTGSIAEWEIRILRHHPLAMPIGERYEAVNDTGAAPASLVRAIHATTGEAREGWITCGSFAFPHGLLELDDVYSLAMTLPRASRYSSDVLLYTKSGIAEEITIQVNKPVAAEGWKLYQYSYDDRFGRWSRVSIIEVIRDPWLPVVYTGIFMMLAGAVYLMFKGRKPDTPFSPVSSHAAV